MTTAKPGTTGLDYSDVRALTERAREACERGRKRRAGELSKELSDVFREAVLAVEPPESAKTWIPYKRAGAGGDGQG